MMIIIIITNINNILALIIATNKYQLINHSTSLLLLFLPHLQSHRYWRGYVARRLAVTLRCNDVQIKKKGLVDR